MPTYDTKHSIYANAIFCNKLPFTAKMKTTINMLPFGTKSVICLTITIKNISTAPLNLKSTCESVGGGGYSDQLKFKHSK